MYNDKTLIFKPTSPSPAEAERSSGSSEQQLSPRALAQCASPEARALLPFEQALQLRALPLGIIQYRSREVLSVAVDSNRLAELTTSLRFATGKEVRLVGLPEAVVTEAIFHAYRGDEQRLAQRLESIRGAEEKAVGCSPLADLPPARGEAAQFLEALIEFAISRLASDIHIIPRVDGTSVRLRIKGELLSSPPLFGPVYHSQIVNRIKILARLDTSQHHLPLDGAFTTTLPHGEARLRVSTLPTLHGEKVVLRCMGAEKIPSLDQLLFPAPLRSMLDQFLKRSEGALLFSGPTGSGKSTSMYSIVQDLAQQDYNVITVEDPIEYSLHAISQSAVDEKIGLTYANCLRAILRQDPDVILIGEMRDSESAQIALQAALTGHLIVSTVHARSVFEVLLRLRHLGIDPLTIAQSLELLICQRLLPKLCPSCKVVDLHRSNVRGFTVYRKVGCAHCDYSGTAGSVLVAESLALDPTIKAAIRAEKLDYERLLPLCTSDNYYPLELTIADVEKNGIIEEQPFTNSR